jgi:hypothetical protein
MPHVVIEDACCIQSARYSGRKLTSSSVRVPPAASASWARNASLAGSI